MKLFLSAIAKFSLGVFLVGGLLFVSAGAFDFWQGWLLMGVLFIPMFIAGLVMLAKNPTLLQERLQAKEKRKTQDMVVKISGLMFIAGFVLSGLNFRFQCDMRPTRQTGLLPQLLTLSRTTLVGHLSISVNGFESDFLAASVRKMSSDRSVRAPSLSYNEQFTFNSNPHSLYPRASIYSL